MPDCGLVHTKYILNNRASDYKTRLVKLEVLPLMYIFELSGITVFIKSIKNPTSSFNVLFLSLPVPDIKTFVNLIVQYKNP